MTEDGSIRINLGELRVAFEALMAFLVDTQGEMVAVDKSYFWSAGAGLGSVNGPSLTFAK